ELALREPGCLAHLGDRLAGPQPPQHLIRRQSHGPLPALSGDCAINNKMGKSYRRGPAPARTSAEGRITPRLPHRAALPRLTGILAPPHFSGSPAQPHQPIPRLLPVVLAMFIQ